ncbi:hypothetical protein [Laribacter hongkongensis]|uniref:hypothetical protein n=1 Tax=Laribacter hongkongensis TaxID=168471 RepID=UPI00402B3295
MSRVGQRRSQPDFLVFGIQGGLADEALGKQLLLTPELAPCFGKGGVGLASIAAGLFHCRSGLGGLEPDQDIACAHALPFFHRQAGHPRRQRGAQHAFFGIGHVAGCHHRMRKRMLGQPDHPCARSGPRLPGP